MKLRRPVFSALLAACRPVAALALLSWSAAARAQVAAVARLDVARVETGNTFALRLAVPLEAGQPDSVEFRTWDGVFPRENILQQSGWSRGAQYWNNHLTLIAFDSAVIRFPSLVIRLRGGATALTNPVTLRVYPTPSPGEVAEMADIKDIRREPAHWTDYWPAAVVLLALALGAWLLRRYFARRRQPKRRDAGSRKVELAPHQRALRRLDALAGQRLWQNGRVKDYYAELTAILREYLEKRYRIRALESTSAEIVRDLRRADFPGNLVAPLEELLQQADLAKFAQGQPPEVFHEQALQNVRNFIITTAPKPN